MIGLLINRRVTLFVSMQNYGFVFFYGHQADEHLSSNMHPDMQEMKLRKGDTASAKSQLRMRKPQ